MTILFMNPLKKAKFLTSVAHIHQLIADEGKEVAFVGRSNCGKSSLLNALTEQTKLARVSKTPGRTQMINFFELPLNQRLVDLPGYGFAKVDSHLSQQWQSLINDYLKDRRSLAGVVLINDIRHPMKAMDEQMLAWCQHHHIPVLLVLNKSDKLSRQKVIQTKTQIKKLVKGAVTVCEGSAAKHLGLEAMRDWICQHLSIK